MTSTTALLDSSKWFFECKQWALPDYCFSYFTVIAPIFIGLFITVVLYYIYRIYMPQERILET